MRSLTIVGGGLAGLALGSALARAGARVRLCDAGRLPRPRVCGEFISGLKPEVVAALGIESHFRDAVPNRTTGWHAGAQLCWESTLPEPALGLSRPLLEQRLLDDFAKAGGEFLPNTRLAETDIAGIIWAAGRRPDAHSPWMGLKIHCRNLVLTHDLEMHLGRGGYVGAARIEGGRVNICGLFHARPELRAPREKLLSAYLVACGLEEFAWRVEQGGAEPESAAAVSGLDFTRTWREENRLALGDHFAPIPPFTGHGMAMALEGAACALGPVLTYVRGEMEWPAAILHTRGELAAREDSRLRWARALHPWLLKPARQRILFALARAGLLPFQFLYRATHGKPPARALSCFSTRSPMSSPSNA